jgi:hypothetical protein
MRAASGSHSTEVAYGSDVVSMDQLSVQELDSNVAYAVTHLFLQETLERTKYEDLIVLVTGMVLSADGERSLDPAMHHDWDGMVGLRTSFCKTEAFAVARAFLVHWYEIGPQEQIKSVIDAMAVDARGEPLNDVVAQCWNQCWETVCEDLVAGEPFKASFWHGTRA